MNHSYLHSLNETKKILLGVELPSELVSISYLEVEGTDAQSYLQGQTTQDISKFSFNEPFTNCVLDNAGRLLVVFSQRKFKENAWSLLVETSQANFLYERLEKYIISESVEISNPQNINQDYPFLYLGPLVSQFFQPENNDYLLQVHGVTALLTSRKIQDWSFLKVTQPELFWKNFKSGQGVTSINSELFTNTIYSEYALSLTKGCYLGQETVAKIVSRKGAAYYPTFLKVSQDLEMKSIQLKSGESTFKLVGKIQSIDGCYLLVLLPRELRIPGKELIVDVVEVSESSINTFSATVMMAPMIPFDQNQQKQDLYHLLLELSQQDELIEFAVSGLDVFLKNYPTHEDAWEMRGLLLSRLKRYQESIDCFESLSKLNPNSVMACVNLSRIYGELGEIQKAEDYKAEGIVRSFYANAAAVKAEVPLNKPAADESTIKMFLDVLEIDPEDKFALYQLAKIYAELNEWKKLELLFSSLDLLKIIKTDPEFALPVFDLKSKYLKDPLAEQFLQMGIEHAAKLGRQKILQELLAKKSLNGNT